MIKPLIPVTSPHHSTCHPHNPRNASHVLTPALELTTTPQIRVRQRPNPTIDIGSIDSSVSLVLCDPERHDTPIVYCSETFEALTGYNSTEILERNCRFLQQPPRDRALNLEARHQLEIRRTNDIARKELKERFARNEEAQVKLVNFMRDGRMFVNLLTVIPILWDGEGAGAGEKKRYLVGFMGDTKRTSLV